LWLCEWRFRYNRTDDESLLFWHSLSRNRVGSLVLDVQRQQWRSDFFVQRPAAADSRQRGLWLCEWHFRYNRTEDEPLLCWHSLSRNRDWSLGLDVRRQQWRSEFLVQRPAAADCRQRGLWLCEWHFRYNRTEHEPLLCWHSLSRNREWSLGLDVRRQQWRSEFLVQRPAAADCRQWGLWLCQWRCPYSRTDVESLHCRHLHNCDGDWSLGLDVQRQQWRDEFFVQRLAAISRRQWGLWLGEWCCCYGGADSGILYGWYGVRGDGNWAMELGMQRWQWWYQCELQRAFNVFWEAQSWHQPELD
jgi:hypothetical protein